MLLVLLVLNANRVLSRERVIDELWGEDPPETARKAVQVYVSRLRKVLPEGTLVTRAYGYVAAVDPESIDARRFERLIDAARAATPARASVLLGEALSLWRGPALEGLTGARFARVEAQRLENLRLTALEERVEAELALGRDAELVPELEALAAEHPHRERISAALMIALYRSGRQPEALAAYRNARAALHELGLEPGAELRELERRILAHDPGLEREREPLLVSDGARLPGPLVPEPPFPFVGREAEFATLRAALERAEGGEGALVMLAGEAGAGKTRLVRELAQEAVGRGMFVLYGSSDPAVTTPYQPLR